MRVCVYVRARALVIMSFLSGLMIYLLNPFGMMVESIIIWLLSLSQSVSPPPSPPSLVSAFRCCRCFVL